MHPHTHAHREKSGAALSSLFAAVFLTAMKLAVGLATNSLGILSEAAHSALDLVAAAVTYLAVTHSSRPADERHPYGHGKVENLSALVETLLLVVTCLFIARECVDRLFFHPEPVAATWWSFAVMAASIAIDVSRSRMLRRMAEKHRSQALEADALHFETDIWSSAVVIAGLGCVWLAGALPPGSPWREALEKADAVAALGVCLIVLRVSLRLGRTAVDVLLDGGSDTLADEIRASLEDIPGIRGVGQVRARLSGPSAFVDLALDISRQASFEEAHRIGALAEEAVKAAMPGADVVVHLRPASTDEAGVFETVRGVAARHALAVHGLRAHRTPSGLSLEMHVEVPDGLTLARAHEQVTAFEQALLASLAEPASITSHIEPVDTHEEPGEGGEDHTARIRAAIEGIVGRTEGVGDCGRVTVRRLDGSYTVSFACRMDPAMPIAQAHEATTRLESAIRAELPDISRVVIHVEPRDDPPDRGNPRSGP